MYNVTTVVLLYICKKPKILCVQPAAINKTYKAVQRTAVDLLLIIYYIFDVEK